MWQGSMPDKFTEKDWLSFAPQLSIGACQTVDEIDFPESALRGIADHFWAQGYLRIPDVLGDHELAPVRDAMQALHYRGIPPVYIYLYDQPWLLFARLGELVRHFLGETFAVLPNLWAWHLSREGERGWPPHLDCDAQTVFGVGDAAVLMSLSLWLPLTDANEENGCMYVLPRPKEAGCRNAFSLENINVGDAVALPVKAGSVLGWPQDLYHWGGAYSTKAQNSRLSLSLEFQNCAFDPLAEPLLDLTDLPPYRERRALIEAQFTNYRHIDPSSSLKK